MIKLIKDFIERLAAENEKNFGSGRLNCCDLNKSSNTSKKAINKDK
jgi:hypothetical protein